MSDVRIRTATTDDEPALSELVRRTWSPATEITPRPPAGEPFFHEASRPEDYLIAELDDRVVAYLRLVQPIPVDSCAHVRQIQGLAVDDTARHRGIATALITAAITESRRQHASRLTLRVLSTNLAAQRLYARTGFTLEGTLRNEYYLEEKFVDDLLMAQQI